MTVGWHLEFKSWKGTIRYPAPPQELWNTTQRELADLCRENNIPQLPDFEHKYLAALFAAMGAPITQQVERAIWLLRLRRDNPPVMSTAWHFTYQFFHGTETGSLWNTLKEKIIRPSLADHASVGFYCRASNDQGDWSTVHCIRRVPVKFNRFNGKKS